MTPTIPSLDLCYEILWTYLDTFQSKFPRSSFKRLETLILKSIDKRKKKTLTSKSKDPSRTNELALALLENNGENLEKLNRGLWQSFSHFKSNTMGLVLTFELIDVLEEYGDELKANFDFDKAAFFKQRTQMYSVEEFEQCALTFFSCDLMLMFSSAKVQAPMPFEKLMGTAKAIRARMNYAFGANTTYEDAVVMLESRKPFDEAPDLLKAIAKLTGTVAQCVKAQLTLPDDAPAILAPAPKAASPADVKKDTVLPSNPFAYRRQSDGSEALVMNLSCCSYEQLLKLQESLANSGEAANVSVMQLIKKWRNDACHPKDHPCKEALPEDARFNALAIPRHWIEEAANHDLPKELTKTLAAEVEKMIEERHGENASKAKAPAKSKGAKAKKEEPVADLPREEADEVEPDPTDEETLAALAQISLFEATKNAPPKPDPAPKTAEQIAFDEFMMSEREVEKPLGAPTYNDSGFPVYGVECIQPILPKVSEIYQLAPAESIFERPKSKRTKRPPLESDFRRYLGRAFRSNTMGSYVNFAVQAESIHGEWVAVDETIRTRFPKYGAFNVHSNTVGEGLKEGMLMVIDLENNFLNDNIDHTTFKRREDYEYRVEYQELVRAHCIHEAREFDTYLVVYPKDQVDFAKSIHVNITTDPQKFESSLGLKAEQQLVLLAYQDHFYGPVALRRNAQQEFYVNFQTGSTRGVVSGYKYSATHRPLSVSQFLWLPTGFDWIKTELLNVAPLTPVLIDTYSDKDLLEKAINALSIPSTDRTPLIEWAKGTDTQDSVFSSEVDIREARYTRIMNLLTADKETTRFYSDIVQLTSLILKHAEHDRSSFFDDVANQLAQRPEFISRLESIQSVRLQKESLIKQRDDLEEALAKLETNFKNTQEHFDQELRQTNKKLLKEKEKLDEEIKLKQLNLTQIDEIKDISKYLKTLNAELEQRQKLKDELNEEIKQIGESLKGSVKDYRHLAFDGVIANQFLEAAALWTQDNQNELFNQRADQLLEISVSKEASSVLKTRLLEAMKAHRHYSNNDILNLFICLTQNFLTVFSGPPGSGKTSICNLLADVLGLNSVAEHIKKPELWTDLSFTNRYVPVSVERGWTGKRDFVGYWNPLTKAFESVDQRRYEAFKQLDVEARKGVSTLPFMMLLDEANLSPMEYYWADFMNICDGRDQHSAISLGDKVQYRIPDTLRFVATINNDHTTEMLSPRLIDRATIVTLPEMTWTGLDDDLRDEPSHINTQVPLVSWEDMKRTFGARRIDPTQGSDVNEKLSALYSHMQKGGFTMSIRVQKSIAGYISAALELFEKEENRSVQTIAVDYAVSQKVLPHISGNGEAFHQWLVELQDILENYGLDKSKEIVAHILDIGNQQMSYYRFF